VLWDAGRGALPRRCQGAGRSPQPHGAPAAGGKRVPTYRPEKANTSRGRGSRRVRAAARRVAEARSGGGWRQHDAAASEGAGVGLVV
jgi:hypothetical protein